MEDRGHVLTRLTALKADIAAAFAERSLPYLIIKHICTTTVPGLAEEPMDNLLIVITATDFRRDIFKRQYIGILGRCTKSGNYQFQQGRNNQGKRTFRLLDIESICHVYIVAEDSYFWKRPLAAGDALRSDADLKNVYERCERSFAEGRYPKILRYLVGYTKYSIRKNLPVRQILRRAGWSDEEIDKQDRQYLEAYTSKPHEISTYACDTFRFLELPAEIRNVIYEMVLPLRIKACRAIVTKPTSQYLALTRTSHQLRNESRAVMYEKSIVCIDLRNLAGYVAFSKWLTDLTSHHVSRLGRLEIEAYIKMKEGNEWINFRYHVYQISLSANAATYTLNTWTESHPERWIRSLHQSEELLHLPKSL